MRPPPGVAVAVGVGVSVAVIVADGVAVGVAVGVGVPLVEVAVGVPLLEANAITRLVALTVPMPVSKSHPAFAANASWNDEFEVDSTPTPTS
jgi:hypothetical protein